MSELTIEERVKKVCIDHLCVMPERVTSASSFIDDLGADSLDAVELIMGFEEEFDIEITDADAEKITTVQEAVDFVISKNK